MVTASFKEGQKTAITTSLQKYDYGEVLRIKGLSLPRYVAVQFAVDGMSEALPSSIGETVEDVTDVLIPNSLLRSNIKPWNYNIMAYVYIVSGSSGKTEYTITIPVKWRPKTGDDQAADDDVAAVIGSAVEKMNTATTKAENAANHATETAEEIKADREKITTNEIKIAGLKSDLGDFRDASGILCSSNLINADNSKYHYELSLSDGTEKKNSGDYSISEYIEIEENTPYTLDSWGAWSFLRICYYKNDKTFISGIFDNTYTKNKTYISVKDASFCRFMIDGEITKGLFFGKTNGALNYSVYGTCIQKEINDNNIVRYKRHNLIDVSAAFYDKKIINYNTRYKRGMLYSDLLEDNNNYYVSSLVLIESGKTYTMYYYSNKKFNDIVCRRWFLLDSQKRVIEKYTETQSITVNNPFASYLVVSQEIYNQPKIVIVEGNVRPDNISYAEYKNTISDDTGLLMSKNTAYGWNGKNICAYGDSITHYGFWLKNVARWFGFAKAYNLGISGSKVRYDKNEPKWWVSDSEGKVYCSEADSSSSPASDAILVNGSFSSPDRVARIPLDTDVVLIMGGTNDMFGSVEIGEIHGLTYDKTNFIGGLAETVKLIGERLPNAQIVLMTCLYNADKTITPYNDAIKKCADELGIAVIDAHSCGINCFNAADKLRDGTHPTYNVASSGSDMLASRIIDGLKTIRPHYNDYFYYQEN